MVPGLIEITAATRHADAQAEARHLRTLALLPPRRFPRPDLAARRLTAAVAATAGRAAHGLGAVMLRPRGAHQ